ncbi:MAG: ABC transporter permease [Verrucomicrobiia bacterium]
MKEAIETSEVDLAEESAGKELNLADILGRKLFYTFDTVKGVIAFTLISLTVLIKKFNRSKCVIHPLIAKQIKLCGVSLVPIMTFISLAIGFLVVGQTITLLSRFGVKDFAGVLMVAIVVRELGPIAAALIIMAKVGTTIVVELGTSRALGEVESLEALGIDPIHYFVVPRIVGVVLGAISLTVYIVIFSLLSGYLFAFLQEVPLQPSEYLRQIADTLLWSDFILVSIKAIGFGLIISIVCCYYGLAKPLNLKMISRSATSAIIQAVVGCVALDVILIFINFVVLG